MKGKAYIPGLAMVLGIAFFSYSLSTVHASFDALVVSIIIGMFAGNLIGKREGYEKGTEAAVKLLLPLGIALYGSELTLKGLHIGFVFTIFLVFACLFGLTYLSAGIFGIEKKTSVLLASGLAVCGATAIAVVSPLIGARREDTSVSIIAVVMLGLTGMIFYPMLQDAFSLSTREFSFLAGTTLPMLGQVKVAAGSMGPKSEAAAVEIKLIRIFFLLFLVSTAVLISGRQEKQLRIPWFVTLFIILVGISNFTDFLRSAIPYLGTSSSFLLSAGLAAVGFSVDFESVMERGIRPLAAIFLSWGTTILFIYLAGNVL